MTAISAVIITRNEARNIQRCISSLKNVADEVIVVDAESDDGTRELAKELGAEVHVRKWTNYSDQKNFANSLAKHSYILSMDADEALSPELEASILQLKQKQFDAVYSVSRYTNYCGHWVKHGGWYPDAKVRLFPKKDTRWEGAHVHETLVLPKGMKEVRLRGDLLHYSYHTITDHQNRIQRYSTLHAQSMFENGRKAGVVKRWLSPVAKFIQGYLFQLGVLDGWAGWKIATLSAQAVYLKYSKLSQLNRGGTIS